ncbi:MAG: uroporphyrinogen-III C-methyltransferase [Clostridium sp.]
MIYLCGAGCGDWELMTLRAMRMLKRADCILYDRLLDPEILQFAPKHCECIYVGKQAANHAMTQEQIQDLLIEKGRQYETVIRLKGGSLVCLASRRGSQALYAQECRLNHTWNFQRYRRAGICGIPITHRDYATGARLMSAHSKQDTLPELDYAGMAHTRDTLILYGTEAVVRSCERIAGRRS